MEDTSLTDAAGQPVQLTGMSSHGLLWYPEYTNANAMQTLKSCGANAVRIAVYSDDRDGGYAQEPVLSRQLTSMAIENAVSADMYVIVDWHVLNDCSPLNSLENARSFFWDISSRYGDCPNILYEICNEPNGGTTWEDIRQYADVIIPLIRGNAPNAVIIVGTPDYSYSVTKVFDAPLDYDNVMYSFHFYAGQFGNGYGDILDDCARHHIPVFVSEWGINYGADGQLAISQGEAFVKALNKRGISWMAWSLCNKDEAFSALKPDCVKLSGWLPEDLTDVGQVFFNAFQEKGNK